MTERRKVKGVLGQMLAHIDENEMAKVSNRMLIAAKISGTLHQRGVSQKQFATMMDKSESEFPIGFRVTETLLLTHSPIFQEF